MIRYQFAPDRGHHALAWGQAEAYPGDDNIQKIKGNLAEIAFYEFCRHTLPIEQWHWHNGEFLRRAEQEYCEHDFTIGHNTVDVKGRSRVKDLFDLKSIDSDLVVLVGIPSDLADDVAEAENLLDFARRGPADYDPVVILGLVDQADISPESYELDHPAPGGPRIERLPLKPAGQLPTGIAIEDWLQHHVEFTSSGDEVGQRQYEGIRQFHTSSNGETLLPGSFVTPTDRVGLYTDGEDFPARGMVVECPDQPAGATFNGDTKRYETTGGITHGRTPAIGVIAIEHLSEEITEEIGQLCEEHVYPAVSQLIYSHYDDSLVKFTGSSAVRKEGHIRSTRFNSESPLSNSWWPSTEEQ
ncbi:hypothetical protein ACFO5R_02425 [Halosolutus amylolyticus]|uniref:DUF7961 domain-containing protein n=1 Tax=Halosolutus amylolyticus TaxID=2932267 RepID=A0ABD5PJN8_9EURY|nr:hypothetical protein [Halosolutus amylolyticus]